MFLSRFSVPRTLDSKSSKPQNFKTCTETKTDSFLIRRMPQASRWCTEVWLHFHNRELARRLSVAASNFHRMWNSNQHKQQCGSLEHTSDSELKRVLIDRLFEMADLLGVLVVQNSTDASANYESLPHCDRRGSYHPPLACTTSYLLSDKAAYSSAPLRHMKNENLDQQ